MNESNSFNILVEGFVHSCTHAAPIKTVWDQTTLLLSILFCLYFSIEMVTSKNMQEYRFSLTIFSRIRADS